MACLIFEFCDSATLFTLSMTCTKIRTHLTSENLQDRAMRKGYLIKILKYKYSEAANRLQGIQRHLLITNIANASKESCKDDSSEPLDFHDFGKLKLT